MIPPTATKAAPDAVGPEPTSDLAAEKTPEQAPRRPTAGRRAMLSRPESMVRVVSHLVIWSVVWVPTVTELSKGWRPLFDDATISERAYQVFSLHSPLVGPYSQATTEGSHVVFGLGPLLFWLLAVPVHIDPAQGALWGVAIWCAVALSAAAEAAWSRVGWIGCAVVAAVVVDLAWTEPVVFGHLLWNPSVGLIFFVVTVVLASVVAMGSLGWWPVLVLTASVAAQCHLVFALTAVALALLAPVVGLVRHGRTDRFRWLWAGVGVGVICWIAPLMQQITSHPGNLSVLMHTDRTHPGLGIGWGLRILATSGSPHPIWLTRSPTGFFPTLVLVHGHSSEGGVVVLGLIVAVTVLAWIFGRRNLAALGAVAVICSAATVLTFTTFPASNVLLLTYLHVLWWVPGILLWIVAIWAVVELLRSLALRIPPGREGWWPSRVTEWWRRAAAAGVVAALLIAGFFGARALVVPTSKLAVDWNAVAQVNRIAPVVESHVPRGPVVVDFTGVGGNLSDDGILLGVAWRLTADGWHAVLPGPLGAATGSVAPAGSRWPAVVVTFRRGSEQATVARTR
ncbi:MAG TPA: hypothetical protein VG226_12250 [Acidimicrobiales bacterium]|nr:hypothetical protein [Acidimicrobiales bacterium]